ncbi:MAG: crosslink repair DNA glycosylase YcaQ family protein [Comamonas sp.]
MPHPISLTFLQQLALSQQGLGAQPAFGSGMDGTLHAIAHLGYVQIDTLSVIERAHHHVLWSRVPGYAPEHLNQLCAQGQIFEYWFHAAAYLPMRDYRFALPRMQSFRRGESPYFKSVEPRLMAEILARVRGEGELRSRDLKDRSQGAWWNHGPGRRALDKLFMQGDVMIRERKGMEKVYVLPEQLLPADTDLSEPSAEEMAAHLLEQALRAHGVVTWAQLVHLRTGKALCAAMRELLDAQVAAGQLINLTDSAQPDTYLQPSALAPSSRGKPADKLRLLSPFDNAVIHRDRLQQLFDFNYRLESYTPAAKRIYGYFCLPILWRGRFVGRVDCKANRTAGRLVVLSLHLESGIKADTQFSEQLTQALQQLAQFCGCNQVQQ